MIFIKTELSKELPQSGVYVTTIDESGQHRVYKHNNDNTWTMRDADGSESPNNNLIITHWLKPAFSDDELEYLKSIGWFSYSLDKTELTRESNQFTGYSLTIQADGTIKYWSMEPFNIDCDTGKSDTKTNSIVYNSFE